MLRSIFFSALAISTAVCQAQSYVHQVFVLNEGYYDYFGNAGQVVPVSLGSYDPATNTYQTVATLVGPRFASGVLVDGSSVYVAADDRVYRFDVNTHVLLAEAQVQGVRKLAVWNDKLLLTRGELGGLPHYFEMRDKTDLLMAGELGPDAGLSYSAEDIMVIGDRAYLAVSNAFDWDDLQGRIGIVDLPSLTYITEVDLGPDGLNPEKLMVHEGDLVVFNNKDLSGSSISRVSISGAELIYTTNVSVNSGCAASAKVTANNSVYFLEYAQNELARFDLSTGTVVDTLAGSPAIYGLVEDPLNGVLFATTTDFTTYGNLHVMGLAGEVLSSVAVGVAPGNLALDIRSITGMADRSATSFTIHPNPAQDWIMLGGDLPGGELTVDVADATGRTVLTQVIMGGSQPRLSVVGLKPGAYFLRLNGQATLRFMKQ